MGKEEAEAKEGPSALGPRPPNLTKPGADFGSLDELFVADGS